MTKKKTGFQINMPKVNVRTTDARQRTAQGGIGVKSEIKKNKRELKQNPTFENINIKTLQYEAAKVMMICSNMVFHRIIKKKWNCKLCSKLFKNIKDR